MAADAAAVAWSARPRNRCLLGVKVLLEGRLLLLLLLLLMMLGWKWNRCLVMVVQVVVLRVLLLLE